MWNSILTSFQISISQVIGKHRIESLNKQYGINLNEEE